MSLCFSGNALFFRPALMAPSPKESLARQLVLTLAFGTAASVATIYLNQPLLPLLGRELHATPHATGLMRFRSALAKRTIQLRNSVCRVVRRAWIVGLDRSPGPFIGQPFGLATAEVCRRGGLARLALDAAPCTPGIERPSVPSCCRAVMLDRARNDSMETAVVRIPPSTGCIRPRYRCGFEPRLA